jgi:serine/threonine protein kinase
MTGKLLHDRYCIRKTLGEGGMSKVYLAEDRRLHNRRLAIKEMMPCGTLKKQSEMKVLFQREAQILCILKHPNLPQVTDFFMEGESHFLVMEFVQGETLNAILQSTEGFIPEDLLRDWGIQLCQALEYLHGQNPPIIYRDIKPSNIILTDRGRLKLIDFGIARLFDSQKTADTMIIGTPGYASPEQFGRAQTDQRSDILLMALTETFSKRYRTELVNSSREKSHIRPRKVYLQPGSDPLQPCNRPGSLGHAILFHYPFDCQY